MVGQNFFDMPIWNNEETCKQIIGMGRNNDYITGNLLNYEYINCNRFKQTNWIRKPWFEAKN